MNGDQVYLYGDKAFYLEPGVIGAFRAGRNTPLKVEESVFNAYTAKRRISVEWRFGKITQYFHLKLFMKLSLSPISSYFFVPVLFNKLSYLLLFCKNCYLL